MKYQPGDFDMIAALLLSILPMDAHLLRDSVDSAESNAVHYPDFESQRYAEPQWIFRDAGGSIVAWKWDRACSVSYHPPRIWITEGRKVRVIRSQRIYGSHSNFDPETFDRELNPEFKRRGLAQ